MTNELKIPRESSKIYRNFFERDAVTVAKDLLGRVIVQERKNPVYIQLTEIAAYEGINSKNLEEARRKNPNLFYASGIIGISKARGKYLIDIGTKKICLPSCVTLIAGNLFDKKGLIKKLQGSSNISKALDIDYSYDSSPINFGQLWIGGESIEKSRIKQRDILDLPINCKGYFYF